MENIDWKTIGMMAGVSAVVFVLGTLLTRNAIDPMIEKSKVAAKKKKEEAENAPAGT
jgi:hypothetical protein